MNAIVYPLLGYLLGSIPNALWVTRLVKGIDVRDGGSGHVTTTNTIRQAGWLPGVLVLVLDISKGFLPAYLVYRADSPDWLTALTAALTVVGHCWPVFAQFRGGMGLATMGGSFLAIYPPAFGVGVGILVLSVLVIRHSARGAFATALIVPLVLWILGQRATILWVAVAAGVVIAVRFTVDWNRQYRELWLDREN